MDKVGTKINCCPKCGGKIVVSELWQYSYNHVVGKRGKLLKGLQVVNCGPMEKMIASCLNISCRAMWETDEFMIDDNGHFIDLKFTNSERGDDV